MDNIRQLVSVRMVLGTLPIEGADLIELVRVDGWQCVAKVGEFKTGDLCVYCEIDSFLPIQPEFEFLRKSSFKRMGEIEGFRIKTIKLRGKLSQGLVIPLATAIDKLADSNYAEGKDVTELFLLGSDLTEFFGVVKYEAPVPVELSGQVRGNFPSFIRKTDQGRCQNLHDDIFLHNADAEYEETIKLDGTSFTAFYVDGEDGVCGRNWELELNGKNDNNSLVRMFIDSGLRSALCRLRGNYAVQGELMGPSIQQNREDFKTTMLYVFDIYDIDGACYLSPEARMHILEDLYMNRLDKSMVCHVPILNKRTSLKALGIVDIAGLLARAEGPSVNHPIREGNVYKRLDGGFSFKAISNTFLIKEKD